MNRMTWIGLFVVVCTSGVPGFAAEGRDIPTDKQPSLDDLLNLPPTKIKTPDPDKKPDAPKGLLDGVKVADEPKGEAFQMAVLDMQQIAQRLVEDKDTGVETQRVQERVIQRLDQMISDLREQQKQQKGKGKGKGQAQKQDTGSSKNAGKKGGQKGSGQQKSGASSESTDQAGANGSPETKDVSNEPLAERLAEWGALPPRLRDQLMQGLEDRYSGLYRRLTEQYYRRLAEESQ